MVLPDFIKNNISLILVLIYFFLSIVVLLIRMKPSKDVEKVEKSQNSKVMEVIKAIPQFIVTAEKLFGACNGPLKLNFVLNAINSLQKVSGVSLDLNVEEYVESILKTPQRKEESNE